MKAHIFALAAVLAGGLATAAVAQLPADQAVAKRRATMTAAARPNGTINAALRAGTPAPEALEPLKAEAAKVVAAFAEMKNPELWPKGSSAADGVAGTKAKAEIWTDWAGFEAALGAANDAAAKLKTAADAGDVEGMKAGVAAVQASCGGCHSKFRG